VAAVDEWHRGDKNARGVAPQEPSTQFPPAAVPVKAHLRSVPDEEKSLLPEQFPADHDATPAVRRFGL
jgi:hypothetical protein